MMAQAQQGFTLVELMVALVISSLLMMGVGGAYVAIQQTVTEVQRLENAQEVLRSSQLVLGRSIRNADAVQIDSQVLLVERQNRQGSELDCFGQPQATAFEEAYRLAAGSLECRVGDANWQVLLTGLDAIEFMLESDDLLRVLVAPQGLPPHFPQASFAGHAESLPFIRIDLALKTRILVRET